MITNKKKRKFAIVGGVQIFLLMISIFAFSFIFSSNLNLVEASGRTESQEKEKIETLDGQSHLTVPGGHTTQPTWNFALYPEGISVDGKTIKNVVVSADNTMAASPDGKLFEFSEQQEKWLDAGGELTNSRDFIMQDGNTAKGFQIDQGTGLTADGKLVTLDRPSGKWKDAGAVSTETGIESPLGNIGSSGLGPGVDAVIGSAMWAAAIGGMVYMFAGMFGAEPEQAQALGIATFAGITGGKLA